MTVTRKLYFLVCAALLGLFTVAGVGLYQLDKTYVAVNYANINTVPTFQNFIEIRTYFARLREYSLLHVIITDAAGMAQPNKKLTKSTASFLSP
jgi:methyl-accepting chemotaxis protein